MPDKAPWYVSSRKLLSYPIPSAFKIQFRYNLSLANKRHIPFLFIVYGLFHLIIPPSTLFFHKHLHFIDNTRIGAFDSQHLSLLLLKRNLPNFLFFLFVYDAHIFVSIYNYRCTSLTLVEIQMTLDCNVVCVCVCIIKIYVSIQY